MNCPHCQKPLPEKYDATFCLHCGQALDLPEPAIEPRPPLTPVKINWFVFFGVLLAPPILTLLSANLGKRTPNEPLTPYIGFFGGAAAGIACGVMLAGRLGRSRMARVLEVILFSFIFGVVSIGLSLVGCTVGGYQFRFE